MSDPIQEFLVTPTEVLVVTESSPELLEIGIPGPAGPAYAGGPIDMHGAPLYHALTVGFADEIDNGSHAGAYTLALSNGQKQAITLSGDLALTIDPTAAGCGNYQVRIAQDASGGHQLTFANLETGRWLASAAVPQINQAANGESLLSLYWSGSRFIQSLSKVGDV
jgi:hypothetical protein